MKRPLIVFYLLCYVWKFVNSEDTSSVDCKLFKVRTEDASESCGYKDNDTTKYSYQLKGLLKNQPLYKFNTEVKFIALLYNDEFVWQHTSSHDASKFPSELEIDPYNKTLWIKYGGMDLFTFKFEDNKWQHCHELSYGACKTVTIPDCRDTSAPGTPPSPPVEEKVTEEAKEEGEEVKKEEVEVENAEGKGEESDSGKGEDAEEMTKQHQSGQEYGGEEAEEKPTDESAEIVAGGEEGKAAPEAEGAKSLEGTSGKLAKEEKAEKKLEALERSKVTVHTLDDNGTSHENDASQYTVTESGGFLQVEFVNTAKLHKVDYDGVTVWEDSKDPCSGFPKGLYLNLPDNLLWVQCVDKIHTFQRFMNGWEVVESENESQVLKDATKGDVSRDDLLVGNLYPSDHTGAHYSGLRGAEFDENLEDKPEEGDASGSHVAGDAASTADSTDAGSEAKPEGEASKTDKLNPLGGHYKMLGTKADGTEGELGDDDFEVEGDNDHVKVALKADVKMKELHFKRTEFGTFAKHWEHDKVKHGDSHPKVLHFDVKKALVTLEFGARWFYKYNFGGMRPELELFKAPLDASKRPALKLFKLDDDNAEKEMDHSDYHLVWLFDSANGQFHNFEFEGTKLVKLEYNGEELWKHDPVANADKYPKYVAVNAVRKDVRVFVDDGLKFDFEFDSTNNKYKTEADRKEKKVESGKLEYNGKHLKVFTLADDEVSSEEDKEGKLDVVVEDNKVLVGTFKAGVKCVKLEYESKEVWKHEEAKHGTKHPTEVRFNTETLEVVVTFEDKSKFTFKHDSKTNAHVLAHSSVPLAISERANKLKFFKDKTAAEEIGDADLSLSKEFDGEKEFLVHRFNNAVCCYVVKYDNKELWAYDDEYGNNYPASVHYNTGDHEVRVFVRKNWYYFYKFDADKNEHDIYREREPAEVSTSE